MKRMFLHTALVVGAVVLATCSVPGNVSSPISEPGLASYDERLVGTWYAIEGDVDDASIVTITVTPGKDGFLDVAGVWFFSKMGSYPNDGNGDRNAGVEFAWMRWAAHASVIDGETYFNAQIVDSTLLEKKTGKLPEADTHNYFAPHPNRGYWIIRAEIGEDDLLTLHILWEGDLDHATREVACGEKCKLEVHDLSSEELVAAIRTAEPGELFTEQFRLARIEGTYPEQLD